MWRKRQTKQINRGSNKNDNNKINRKQIIQKGTQTKNKQDKILKKVKISVISLCVCLYIAIYIYGLYMVPFFLFNFFLKILSPQLNTYSLLYFSHKCCGINSPAIE